MNRTEVTPAFIALCMLMLALIAVVIIQAWSLHQTQQLLNESSLLNQEMIDHIRTVRESIK
jgi:hypothetical protein